MSYHKNNVKQWARQNQWHINKLTGDDRNTGYDAAHALKTWAELRDRMRAAGGHTAPGTYIYLYESLDVDDWLIIDWGCKGAIDIHIQGVVKIVRNGTFTSPITNRNKATNQRNVITDSTVIDWSGEIGINSGKYLIPTSGSASNAPAWLIKDLGLSQVEMSTFAAVENGVEVFPVAGDSYQIVQCPFIPNYFIAENTGFFFFKNLDMGDENSVQYTVQPSSATGGVQFTYCAVYNLYVSSANIFLFNSAIKTPISLYFGAILMYAGYGGNKDNSPYAFSDGEIETAGELYMTLGATFDGIRVSVINCGFARFVDAMVCNSPDNGVAVNTGGIVRVTELSGKGNALKGLSIGNSGTAFVTYPTAKITGNNGDVDFCGTTKTWSMLSSAGYTTSSICAASIGPV